MRPCSACGGSGSEPEQKTKPSEPEAISEHAHALAKKWSEECRNLFASRPDPDELDALAIDGKPIITDTIRHIIRIFGRESVDTQIKLAYFYFLPHAQKAAQ